MNHGDVNESQESRSSKVSNLGWCCYYFNTYALIIQNIIDLLVSFILLFFGAYLYKNLNHKFSDSQTAWLVASCIIIGTLLFMTCMLSFISISCTSCRCLAVVSGNLATLVAISCLILAITFAILRDNIFEYFDQNKDEIEISESELEFIKAWYTFANICLFLLSILEFVRYQLSLRFRVTSYRIDGEFKALIDEEEAQYNERHEKRKKEIRSKYKNLREYYKNCIENRSEELLNDNHDSTNL